MSSAKLMQDIDRGEVTQLLMRLSAGDRAAEEQIIGLMYRDLRRLAQSYLSNERRNHTLQATALVHDAYMRLVRQNRVQWRDRQHFFAAAAKTMRRVLIDHARGVKATKRTGRKMSLESAVVAAREKPAELLALDNALDRLAAWDSRLARIVEMKFFGGLSAEQIANALEVSVRTVKRDWSLARTWLFVELTKSIDHVSS